ncbi:2-dehydropantoate 2-reductase [Pseudonocardia ailaonensis]|uniref:ketopantoate reductase family protein n=1 Tax=Pseudonocardia ailaonensis TaxID=367279 RepID=UPI0031E1B079
MRYVVYGAGAVGGSIGGRLARAGHDVTLVARGDHLARIREVGLTLDTADGVHTIPTPAVDGAAAVDWSGDPVVLLAVKSQQTEAALEDLVAHAPGVPVVCAQNGVANERAALRRFPHVHGLNVLLPASFLEPGRIVERCGPLPGVLDLGRYPAGTDDVDNAVAADLRSSGYEAAAQPDIMARKYRKLLMNMHNAVDALCGVGSPEAAELTARARAEGGAVLAAAGVAVAGPDARDGLIHMREGTPSGGSTWQSLVRGQSSEIDYLAGEIVLTARLHGVPAPVNTLLQRRVHALAASGAGPRSVAAAELLAELDTP